MVVVDLWPLTQLTFHEELDGVRARIIEGVLAANADKLAEYRSGKDKPFGFFVGQVMKAMQGKGNPAVVIDVLKQKLG
jgi:aspartyl-tRNA(Asn)/glutamyl-tRNA(Gln) amidotransferase subunit B